MLEGIADNLTGLWLAAILASLCAALCGWGAMRGILAHRVPRILVAVAVAFIAASYWIDVTGHAEVGADMRRGAGLLLWPSLSWTAWSGIVYSRRVVAEAGVVEEAVENLALRNGYHRDRD